MKLANYYKTIYTPEKKKKNVSFGFYRVHFEMQKVKTRYLYVNIMICLHFTLKFKFLIHHPFI